MAYTSYFVYKKMVSYDDGVTWQEAVPYEAVASGDPIASYETLEECGECAGFLYAEENESGATYVKYCGDRCQIADLTTDVLNNYMWNDQYINPIGRSNNYVTIKFGCCCYSCWLPNDTMGTSGPFIKDAQFEEGLVELGNLMSVCDYRDYAASSANTIHIPDSVLVKSGFEGTYDPNHDWIEDTKHPNISFGVNSNLEILGGGGLAAQGGIVNFTTPSKTYYVGNRGFYFCGGLENLTIGADFVGIDIVGRCPKLKNLTFTSNKLRAVKGTNVRIDSLSSITIPSSVVYVSHEFCHEGYPERNAADLIKNFGTLIADYRGVIGRNTVIPAGTRYISLQSTHWWDDYNPAIHFSGVRPGLPNIPSSVISINHRGSIIDSDKIQGSNSALWYADPTKAVVCGCVDPNKTTYTASDFDSTTRFILGYSFGNKITSVDVPEGVVQLSDYAFAGCTALTAVTLPSSLLSIGGCAFSGCTSLSNIVIPNSVKYIGDYAFFECSSLTSITLSNDITEISRGCFSACTSLSSITIPSSVELVRQEAFNDCRSLQSLIVPSSVKMFGEIGGPAGGFTDYGVLAGCTSLTSVTFNEGTRIISAFDDKWSLGTDRKGQPPITSLSIPSTVFKLDCFPDTMTSVTFANNSQLAILPTIYTGSSASFTPTVYLPPSIIQISRTTIAHLSLRGVTDLYITSPCVVKTTVYADGNVEYMDTNRYISDVGDIIIHVPSYLLTKYKGDELWYPIASNIVPI